MRPAVASWPSATNVEAVMIALNTTVAAFAVGLVASAGIFAILLVTLTTDRQLWPPGEKTRAYYLHWTLVWLFNGSLVTVAVLDWNAWLLPRPGTLFAGVVLAVVGTAVFLRSASVMRSAEMTGVTGELYTGGPYAYSRNPQYVGMIVGIVGAALLVNSVWVAVLAAAHIGWVVLLPRAEEPHLRAAYGEAYEQYTARVPRFVGDHTVRMLIAD
ncbi:methyltransferase family protein [Halocatena salina]|uniref:Isoprenylcysteine carboxylmethyltransferase family protein n=1 Tax=Halocatena salina TaxID=2934340 RepID=A0A8U0A315_9EURY|nr:isoprenylcysteine carboxylmethyltransferase family protein [Halocatena salina]UPM42818.1 isoprenylcysteine carboxylmethyltransferase family protein [Halocatena salina]